MRMFLAWVCVCVLAYTAYILSKPQLPSNTKTVSPSDVMASAQTGDVVLFVSKTAGSGYLLLNPYTHVGVIVRSSTGTPYLIETHATGDGPQRTEPPGVHAYTLEYRLQHREGRHVFIVPVQGKVLQQDADDTLRRISTWKNTFKYNESFVRDEFVCHFTGIMPKHIANRMHCGNFAAFVLRHLGIGAAHARVECIRPIDVVSSMPLNEGYAYTSIQRII